MIFSAVGAGERVLLVWADLGAEPQHLQTTVEQIQGIVGKHFTALYCKEGGVLMALFKYRFIGGLNF